ncbi:MAG: hypothetical protein AB2L14_34805 [Candidatus Xenobiia bacterium LiM19]
MTFSAQMTEALAREDEERHAVEIDGNDVIINGMSIPRKTFELANYAM